jgi:LasA protease
LVELTPLSVQGRMPPGKFMNGQNFSRNFKFILITFGLIFAVLMACARAASPAVAPWNVSGQSPVSITTLQPGLEDLHTPVAALSPGSASVSPTPDPPRVLPTPRIETETYTVKSGDTLGQIAQRYSIGLDSLVQVNQLSNPNLLEIGQVLTIPPPEPGEQGPSFKIIPDSELVYGPASVDFDISKFVQEKGGYLSLYRETVDDQSLSGAQIVERISYEYSINPRLLLALLEYRSGWVTRSQPEESTFDYPIGIRDASRKGLYRQLAWAGNFLNRGFYLWRVNGVGAWVTPGGSIIPINPTINAGTAAIQHIFSLLYNRQEWDQAVGEKGLFAVYRSFFGYPFERSFEPLLPPGLTQPPMILPFEEGKEWSYTGGPHGGWGSGSAWAALDFAPPGRPLGCVSSDEWIVAVADGLIVRSGDGAVVQDLDGDGHEQTGWTVLYMHIETRDRVQVGTYVRTGERIGHASCEGGYSTGTHVHLARRYNGEWIPADQPELRFVLDGWSSFGAGREYDGYLIRDGHRIEALNGRSPSNAISR